MDTFVDGYVLPLSQDKLEDYRRLTALTKEVWRDHGALDYRECVADDPQESFSVPFAKTVDLQPGETVVFSWIVFASREERDRINALAMADPRLQDNPLCRSFDFARMIHGGFTTVAATAK